MIRLFSALLITVSLVLCSPTAHAGKRKDPDVVEDALAYAITDRAKAVTLLENALSDGPAAKNVVAITLFAGEQRRLSNDLDAAHKWFSAVLEQTDKGMDYESARLGLALVQAAGGADARTIGVLKAISEKDVLETQNADRFLLLAIEAARANDADLAAQNSRKALTYGKEDPGVWDRIKEALGDLATEPEGSVSAPRLSAGTSDFDKAEKALASGHQDEARKLAKKAVAAAKSDTERRAAGYLLRRVDGARVTADKIAVLLPLTGKYEAVGQQVSDAIEFGYRQARGDRKLVFIDSGTTPETAVAALEKAVIDDGVIAVAGPLLNDQTEAFVAASEALNVPTISLSSALDDPSGLQWVVQGMVTARDQIEALLDEVMDKQGLKSFLIFSPDNDYGTQASALFEELVIARGGKIPATEFYDSTANDMLQDAKILGRKDYTARSREFYDLKNATKEAGGNPRSVVLPPVMDFDAIFLPEKAARVPLACAALAYEEFPMGDFQPTKTSPVIPMLGLSGWNNASLVQTGGPYARRGYFTDAFLLESTGEEATWHPAPDLQAFIDAYRSEHNRTPSPREAITADVGRLLAAATATGASTRSDLRDAIMDAKPGNTVTGLIGINPETRRTDREMLILTITNDGIIPRAELPTLEEPR